MKSGTPVACLLAIALIAMLPVVAGAEGVNCTGPSVLVPDGRITLSTIPTATNYYWIIFVQAGRSYSVETRFHKEVYNSSGPTMTLYANNAGGCDGTSTVAFTDTQTFEPKQTAFAGNSSGHRVSFTATDTWYWVKVNNATGGTEEYTITASDTTQFSPAWSTISSYDTYYSFYNTTNSTCNVVLTLVDTGGTLRTTFNGAVTTGTTLSTNTNALGTARGMAGTAKLTLDCPPGGILAEAAIANFSISPTPYFQFIHFQPTRESAH